ncbi:hypothetical protein LHP98_18690 [Rhodobacter sp. Har01]|uniref:hypothetical protein n=1 Tax=Rhodobacter sp. Har01 TaxID=2883999 RepID=UPI001D07E61B|nr:hypothetical protein [Rhodobacter sp. Har01]MCB6180148.1 hypothetical protein [Rhodobacter sp. Har01]
MTKPQTVLELARHDAQELHKKISGNVARAEQATWADVKAVQADINALGARMKTLAEDQADAVKSGIKAALTKMDAAGKLVEDKTVAGATAAKDGVKHANDAMLESVHNATTSLSAAVAAARSKLAHAIEPKKPVA